MTNNDKQLAWAQELFELQNQQRLLSHKTLQSPTPEDLQKRWDDERFEREARYYRGNFESRIRRARAEAMSRMGKPDGEN